MSKNTEYNPFEQSFLEKKSNIYKKFNLPPLSAISTPTGTNTSNIVNGNLTNNININDIFINNNASHNNVLPIYSNNTNNSLVSNNDPILLPNIRSSNITTELRNNHTGNNNYNPQSLGLDKEKSFGVKSEVTRLDDQIINFPLSKQAEKRSKGGRKRKPTDNLSEKKINFLERNRIAALKCREKKKRLVSDTETDYNNLKVRNAHLENLEQNLIQEIRTITNVLQKHMEKCRNRSLMYNNRVH